VTFTDLVTYFRARFGVEEGQTMAEYGVVLAVITALVVVALLALSGRAPLVSLDQVNLLRIHPAEGYAGPPDQHDETDEIDRTGEAARLRERKDAAACSTCSPEFQSIPGHPLVAPLSSAAR
jgi:Flp pilus assembly pilin Flp